MLFIRQGIMMHADDRCFMTCYKGDEGGGNSEGEFGTWAELLKEAHAAALNAIGTEYNFLTIFYEPSDDFQLAVASTLQSEVENG